MIVPVKAACRRAERAAHDQPHDQLNPFAAGLTQIFYMLDPACLFAFADKHVHETVVPLAIKQACTRALKLVAHAASAPDLDVEVLGKALDCTRNGLSQSPAAIPAWHRVGDAIDSPRDDLRSEEH